MPQAEDSQGSITDGQPTGLAGGVGSSLSTRPGAAIQDCSASGPPMFPCARLDAGEAPNGYFGKEARTAASPNFPRAGFDARGGGRVRARQCSHGGLPRAHHSEWSAASPCRHSRKPATTEHALARTPVVPPCQSAARTRNRCGSPNARTRGKHLTPLAVHVTRVTPRADDQRDTDGHPWTDQVGE